MTSVLQTNQLLDYFTIVSDGEGERLLLAAGEHGTWSLPRWQASAEIPWQQVDHVNRTVWCTWGLKVTTLRCICNRLNSEDHRPCRIYEMETHGFVGTQAPAGCRWVTENDLDALDIPEPGHRLLMRSWYMEGHFGGRGETQAPWTQPGWIAKAVAWMLDQLKRLDTITTGSVEQYRISSRSCMLRAATDSGVVYFKAQHPCTEMAEKIFQWEFAPYFAEYLPSHLAADDQRSWSLTRAPFADHSATDDSDATTELDDAMTAIARMQISTVAHLSSYSDIGVEDSRLSRLPARISELFQQVKKRGFGLTADETGRLVSLQTQLLMACAELNRYQMPAVLEFGEFAAGAVPEEPGLVIADWSSPCVTHPFFRMHNLAGTKATGLANGDELASPARDAYLSAWTDYETPDRLIEAFKLASLLAPLHYAHGFLDREQPNAESNWETVGSIAYYLRLALARMG